MKMDKSAIARVRSVLEHHPGARDSYEVFLYFYIERYHGSPENVTVKSMLSMMKNGVMPKWNTLERHRRVIQEEHPELRGVTYVERQRKAREWRADMRRR